MSQESLKQFVQQEFLQPGATQDQLKATASFDEFVDVMVNLGRAQGHDFTAEDVKTFVQQVIDSRKTEIQQRADEDKARASNLPETARTQMQAIRQAEADKLKAEIDSAISDRWEQDRIVEASIANLRGDDVLMAY